jgi:hypothetical protein
MLPVDYNDRQKKQTYIFFDFECIQDDRIQCQQGYQPSVFFFGVITFVTVCTEVDATQERSHTGNYIVVVVMIVQVDLLLGCGKKCDYVDTERFLKDKRCIIQMQNKDDMCCARVIVTAKGNLN